MFFPCSHASVPGLSAKTCLAHVNSTTGTRVTRTEWGANSKSPDTPAETLDLHTLCLFLFGGIPLAGDNHLHSIASLRDSIHHFACT